MNWIKNILVWLAIPLLFSCELSPEKAPQKVSISPYIMELDDLIPIINQDTVRVLDLRKNEEFLLGHIPGAINIWRTELQNPDYPYNGMIPTEEQLEALFSLKGIKSTDFLVLYDDHSSCEATRLWWVLKSFGFNHMAILNGGVNAWKVKFPLSDKVTVREPVDFILKGPFQTKGVATLDFVISSIDDSNTIFLDDRSEEEYSGKTLKNGAFDRGRIPGSIHLDWMEFVDTSNGKFKSIDEIKHIINSMGIDSTSAIVTYCHSGVRSAFTYFVLSELLHFENVRNYDGSWVEWTYHQQPIEKDSSTLYLN